MRIADEFGCDTIGIQYQQGLKDLAAGVGPGRRAPEQRRPAAGPACERPSALRRRGAAAFQRSRRMRRARRPDHESRVAQARLFDPKTRCTTSATAKITTGEFVWVFEISGAAPPEALYRRLRRRRQRAPAADVLSRRRRDRSKASASPARSSGAASTSRTIA